MLAERRTLSSPTVERAALVGLVTSSTRGDVDHSLDELARLADAAGATVVMRMLQDRPRPDPATFIGSGKVSALAAACAEAHVDVVIFDNELTPGQLRQLEDKVERKVIDRTQLILDIFARRARTREGKWQVELAQLKYLLPRLVGAGVALSRLGGGIGTRGPGETKLEVDRQHIRRRITKLRGDIKDLARSRRVKRSRRERSGIPQVALAGYTNAGKSTLMNALTHAGVLVEDRLFATLDPTVRRLRLPGGLTVLLADTVGFIHKLPHQLVQAFKSTLEEVREADLLLHLVDAAHPAWPEQRRVVETVLGEIGAGERPVVCVLNKIDLLDPGTPPPAADPEAVSISAHSGEGLPELLATIEARLTRGLQRIHCAFPTGRGDVLAWLRRAGRVVEEYYRDGMVTVTALVPPKVAGQLRKRLPAAGEQPC